MNNSVVLVMNNPVEWKTLIRQNGRDPNRLGADDAVPYYTDREYGNEQFSEEERLAIVSTRPSTKFILVKQECKSGEIVYVPIVPIRKDVDSITSFFEQERTKVHDLVVRFLGLLGGKDIIVRTAHEREERNIEEKHTKSVGRISNPLASVSGNVSTGSETRSEAKAKETYVTKVEKTDSNLNAAYEFLDCHPWMKGSFGGLLEDVKRIHGQYSRTFTQEVSKESSEGFQLGIDVAERYKLIKVSAKHELTKQLKKAVHDVENWEYSITLP